LAFDVSLADDLNISPALASLYELIRSLNVLCDEGKVGKKEAETALDLLKHFDTVLAVLPLEAKELPIPEELQDALKKREEARAKKEWKAADHFRDIVHASGFSIEDTPNGPRLKKS
jgi:cysteinyl-tRNA synthetase